MRPKVDDISPHQSVDSEGGKGVESSLMPLLDDLKKKIEHHRERAEYHQRELKVWQAALSSALREAGPDAVGLEPGRSETKTDFVRKAVWATANGVAPREIRELWRKKKKGKAAANFPYTILGKLVDKGEATRGSDGKYTLTESGKDVVRKAL